MDKKIGPLTGKTWLIVIGGALVVYLLYSHLSGSSSSSSTASQVDPNNPMGLTYAQENADIAAGVDPNTGQSFASEQASADQAYQLGSASGGGGASGGASTTSLDPTSQAELQQVDTDFQILSAQLATGGGVTDQLTPEQTFAGEVTDVTSGITALQGLMGALAPPTAAAGGSATSSTKPRMSVLTAAQKAAGDIAAPFGAKNPGGAPPGYTVVGTGNGNWVYRPVTKTTTNVTTAPKPTGKAKAEPRSTVVAGKKK